MKESSAVNQFVDLNPYTRQASSDWLANAGGTDRRNPKECLTMKNIFARFAKDESGATAIEYGLIAALIAVVIVAGASAVGDSLNAKFDTISTAIDEAGTKK